MDGQVRDEAADFVRGGDVDSDFELSLSTLLGTLAAAFFAPAAQARHDVLGDQAALLGVGEDAAERGQDLAHHDPRAAGLRQRGLEPAYHRQAELSELYLADEGHDVEVEVCSVLGAGAALEFIFLRALEP